MFPVKDIDIENQPVYADMDRTEDADSHIPRQTETTPGLNEPETDDETLVERVICLKLPDHRLALRRDRPLNRLPHRLYLTPQTEIAIDDQPQNASQTQPRGKR